MLSARTLVHPTLPVSNSDRSAAETRPMRSPVHPPALARDADRHLPGRGTIANSHDIPLVRCHGHRPERSREALREPRRIRFILRVQSDTDAGRTANENPTDGPLSLLQTRLSHDERFVDTTFDFERAYCDIRSSMVHQFYELIHMLYQYDLGMISFDLLGKRMVGRVSRPHRIRQA